MPMLTPPEAAKRLTKLMHRSKPYTRGYINQLILKKKIQYQKTETGRYLIDELDLINFAKMHRLKNDQRINRHYYD